MNDRVAAVLVGFFVVAGSVSAPYLTLQAAEISKQQADAFSRKLAQIVGQADRLEKPGTRRTSVSESELNSWFAYSATPLLPAGVAEPHVTMVGNGKLAGNAQVEVDGIGEKTESERQFNLWKS